MKDKESKDSLVVQNLHLKQMNTRRSVTLLVGTQINQKFHFTASVGLMKNDLSL